MSESETVVKALRNALKRIAELEAELRWLKSIYPYHPEYRPPQVKADE